MIKITTLGDFELSGHEGELALSRHTLALLAYLSTKSQEGASRAELSGVLWNTPDARRSSHSLSQLLYSIKNAIPGIIDTRPQGRVAINRGVVHCDYLEFFDLVRSKQLGRAVNVYGGEFLNSFPYITDEFDDWRIATASALRATARGACMTILVEASEKHDFTTLSLFAEKGLLIDPLWEECARIRIEALASIGEADSAIREFEVLRDRLTQQLGRAPITLNDELFQSLGQRSVTPKKIGAHSLPVVGRQHELTELTAAWTEVEEGLRAVIIEGEPGIGKTSVLHHALRRIALRGGRILWYSCSEIESRVPYATIAAFLRQSHVEVPVGSRWSAVLGAVAPEIFGVAHVGRRAPKRLIWEAFSEVVSTLVGTGGLVIAVDNYHWIDELSREVLTYLTKRLAESKILLIVSGRKPTGPIVYEDDHSIQRRIVLPTLAPESVSILYAEFEQRSSLRLSESIKLAISKKTKGHPFYISEILREIAAGNVAADSETDVVPGSAIGATILERLNRTGRSAQALAHVAAIADREMPLSILSEVVGLTPLDAADAVAELIGQGIVADSNTVRFTHDLIAEAVNRSVPLVQRSLWHGRLAQVLSISDPESLDQIARHYESACNRAKTYEYAKLAAYKAVDLEAYSVAAEQYARALNSAARGDRADILLEIARVCARSGQYNRIAPIIAEMEHTFASSNNSEGRLIVATAKCCIAQERDTGLNDLVKQAKELLDLANADTPEQLTVALWQIVDLLKRSGELDLMRVLSHTLESAASSAMPSAQADVLALCSLLRVTSDGLEAAWPLATRAVALASTSANRATKANCLFARGTINLLSGSLIDADRDFRDSLSMAEQCGLESRLHGARANLSVVLLEEGRFDEAEYHANTSLREIGFTRRAYAYGNLALIKLRRNDLASAEHFARALEESHQSAPQRWVPVHSEALLGLIDLQTGSYESAIRRADFVRRFFSDGSGVIDTSHLHILCANVDHLAGQTQRAIETLEREATIAMVRDRIAGARLQLEAAKLQLAAGRVDLAAASISRIQGQFANSGALLLLNEVRDVTRHVSPPLS